MNPDDFDKFGIFMSILQETFSPDKPISKERTKVYFDVLADIPIESIELGVKELLKVKKYPTFPLPREIREAAGFVDADNLDLKALVAFREACSFAYTYGQKEARAKHDDPIIEEAIRLCFGGWEYFQDTDPKNDNWDRKNFVEIYKNLALQGKRDKLLSAAQLIKELKGNREDMKTLEEKK